MKNALVKNAFFKAILNICNVIVPIIIGPYALRILDRDYYDMFNGLNATFQIFLSIGALGIYNYGVREISRVREDKDKCSKFFTEMFVIGLAANILAIIAFCLFSVFTTSGSLQLILSWVLIIQFFGNMFNVEWVNEANENFFFITVKSVIIKLLYMVSVFLLVKQFDDIFWYAFLLGLSIVVNHFISFIYIKRKYSFSFKNISILRHIKPLVIVFLVANITLLFAQLDKVMLKWFVDDRSVTTYQLSQYISSVIYSLFISIVVVAVPRFANMLANEKNKECFETHQQTVDTFYMLMIPVTVGAALLSGEIVMLYGGDQYLDCQNSFALYAILQLVSASHYMLGEALLYTSGNEKSLLAINGVGAGLNILMNFSLVALGIFTAETATLTLTAVYAVLGVLDYIVIKKRLKYKYKLFNSQTLRYLIGSALIVPAVLLTRLLPVGILIRVAISVVVSIILYAVFLWISRDRIFRDCVSSITRVVQNKIKRGK